MRHSLCVVEAPGVSRSSNVCDHTNLSPQFPTTLPDADLDRLLAKVPTDGPSIANRSLIAALVVNTDDELVVALQRFETLLDGNGNRDRAFLKAAVFRMLRQHCEQGHQRLKDLLRDLVAPLEKIVATASAEGAVT